jgi:hypothetical protein
MKAFRRAVVFGTLLGLVGAASAQINMPAPGSPGSSPDYAVRIIATSDLLADRYIARWLRTHYPGWDADPIEYQEIGTERYAVVYITSSNNPARRVYFRLVSRMGDPDDDAPFPL